MADRGVELMIVVDRSARAHPSAPHLTWSDQPFMTGEGTFLGKPSGARRRPALDNRPVHT